MSRRDKIIAMALTEFRPPRASHSLPVQSSISIQDSDADTVTLLDIQKEPIFTDINKLWSRPLDYNDFKTIFDFRNEYSNSFNIVSDIDLNNLVSKTQQIEDNIVTRHSLKCYEQLPLSDEDDCAGNKVNMFQDSDDSVKDKDYAPDCSTDSDSDLSNCSEPAPRMITFNAEIHNNQTNTPKYNHGSQKNRADASNQLEKIQKDLDIILPEASTNQVIASVNEENTKKCVSNRAEKEIDNEETEHIEEQSVNDSCREKENTETGKRENGEVESPSIILPVTEKGFTKSGQPRKRRAYDIKLGEHIKNKTVFRGITKDRKERIISELLPLMPETRRSFWLNLPVSSQVSNID
ncbi:uncharacterized protein LOC123703013 [Colias croceus]|uniref:uncharacterized protein LOC123703013 n=1 Tax=Colias crocea TaxID=72248 RepID=UPI001E27BA32|nr:uncharacterized protein LOC123703013 [Colias croceus]